MPWAAVVLLLPVVLMHQCLNAVGFVYEATYTEQAQKAFAAMMFHRERGPSYEDAEEAYRRVNATRKELMRNIENGGTLFLMPYLAQQALLLYDYELRPWGGWPLGLCFVVNAFTFMVFMNPLVGLNDWPEELAAEVMESRSLRCAGRQASAPTSAPTLRPPGCRSTSPSSRCRTPRAWRSSPCSSAGGCT